MLASILNIPDRIMNRVTLVTKCAKKDQAVLYSCSFHNFQVYTLAARHNALAIHIHMYVASYSCKVLRC